MSDSGSDLEKRLAALVDSAGDAIIGLDRHQTITSWNRGAERVFGYSSEDIVGQPALLLVPEEGHEEASEAFNRALDGQIVGHYQSLRRRKDGGVIPVSLTLSPIQTAAGDVIGISQIARDVSRDNHSQRAARRLAAIVEHSDDAIVGKDLNGIVTSWNRAATRMFGYTAPEMIGRSIRVLIPADRQSEEDTVLAHIRRGEKVDHFETIRQRKDGTTIPISLTTSPILDVDGVVVGASKIARDISERKAAEQERTRLLAAAQEQAAITAKLNEVGAVVASGLNRAAIVQAVIDAATELTGAEFGAFFYNEREPESGDTYQRYSLAGATKEAFAQFPHPRATQIFAPTFHGQGILRLDDVTRDPRFGQNPPYFGLPAGHLPVRSYLAVPVKTRSGDVLGGLFFGHSTAGKFTAQHEFLAAGIGSWAAVALENARLYLEARDASRLKDEFIATMSHELRTPLNAILGYARMMRAGLMIGDKQIRAIETIERNATSLTQIVEDVLDVSRIISGKMRLNVQQVDLPQVIHNALESVTLAAEAKGVRIESILDSGTGPVSGDPERLQQVVWNLVANAVKFTNRGDRIQVRLERVNSHTEVIISDTGAGISAEFLPHIFERFRQEDSGTTRAQGGLGLGLAIARHIVEMHGGSIEAASDGVGHGSTFRILLPLMIVHGRTVDGERVHPQAERAGAPITIPNLLGIRVVAVDDDSDALRLVKEIVEASGAEVWTSDSATGALELIAARRPDVLVADLGLPHMDGFELIARVRQLGDERLRNVAAAALTAYARSEDRAKALRSGFQLHLSKPIDPGELLAAIAALARRTTGAV
jgi:PAS domain S-box-containing protein